MDVLFFLLISSMMISSGEGKREEVPKIPWVMETKQCSVFPNTPDRIKCFEPIKRFGAGVSQIMETLYRRPAYYTMLTVNNVKLADITPVNVSLDTRRSERTEYYMTCTKDTDYNDTEHGTTFSVKNGDRWTYLDAKDLVITTRREKWSCSRRYSAGICFYRIVSEHLTKKNIGEVYFPEEVFIHRIPVPRLQQDERQKYTAVIREIKYIHTYNIKDKIFYDRAFEDIGYKMAEENIGDFIELKRTGGTVTVSNYIGPGSTGKIIYKRKPLIRKDGAFINQQSKATCEEINLDKPKPKSNLFGIFPEWSYSENSEPFKSVEDFRKKFITTRYQMMRCQIEGMPEHTGTFFRVRIEYLFTEDVNEVYVTDTIDKIYKFKLPESSTETSFGIIENFDFNPENLTNVFRFAGTVTMPSDTSDTSETSETSETSDTSDKSSTNKRNPLKVMKKIFASCFGGSKTAP